MMVNIANPIYDSVFKYLMEDERIAKTLISALLKKDFDQSLKEKGNHQVLSVDEDKFNGDLPFISNRVGGKRSSFLPTFVFRPLTPPYVRFRIRHFLTTTGVWLKGFKQLIFGNNRPAPLPFQHSVCRLRQNLSALHC